MASQSNEDAPVGTGMRFDIPEPGATGPWNPSFLSCSFWARPLKALMALCNLRVSFSPTTSAEPSGRLSLAEDNAVLELSIPAGGGSGTGNLNYRGLYDSGTDYAVSDCVHTNPSSGVYNFWIAAIANGPSSSVQAPTWPLPGTIYWQRVETGTGGGTKEMLLKTVQANTLVCCEITDTSLTGPTTTVAKEYRNRHAITSETIEGSSISYTYSSRANNLDGKRSASNGSSTQIEILVPVYYQSEVITVVALPTAISLDGASCVWKEVTNKRWEQVG